MISLGFLLVLLGCIVYVSGFSYQLALVLIVAGLGLMAYAILAAGSWRRR